MHFRSLFVLILSAFLLGGCAVGQAIKNNVQGTHYLQSRNYNAGEATFRTAVRNDGDNPQPNYYLGRFLLAKKEAKEALPYLQKAASLNPNDTDYLFWQGVAYGELGKLKQERKSYEKVLSINEEHLQSLTYLAHNQLKSQEYQLSLKTYGLVLDQWAYSPSALYNRALIAKLLNRNPEARTGWLAYLSAYPSGALAIKATDHLNAGGDFSYRNHYLGPRTITLAKIKFEPFGSELNPEAFPSLDVVGATSSNMANGRLQILVYQKNNKALARSRAMAVKTYLEGKFPPLARNSGGIGVSWFAQAETFKIEGKSLSSGESVRFFMSDQVPVVRADKKKKKRTTRR